MIPAYHLEVLTPMGGGGGGNTAGEAVSEWLWSTT